MPDDLGDIVRSLERVFLARRLAAGEQVEIALPPLPPLPRRPRAAPLPRAIVVSPFKRQVDTAYRPGEQ